MRKVYIINKSGHNYSDAERYGTLCYLSSGHVKSVDANSIYRDLALKLADSSEYDYLVITSLPIMSSIACSILARKHGRLNLLIWKGNRYLERNLMIDQLLEGEKE